MKKISWGRILLSLALLIIFSFGFCQNGISQEKKTKELTEAEYFAEIVNGALALIQSPNGKAIAVCYNPLIDGEIAFIVKASKLTIYQSVFPSKLDKEKYDLYLILTDEITYKRLNFTVTPKTFFYKKALQLYKLGLRIGRDKEEKAKKKILKKGRKNFSIK